MCESGKGRTADVLRNLCYKVHEEKAGIVEGTCSSHPASFSVLSLLLRGMLQSAARF